MTYIVSLISDNGTGTYNASKTYTFDWSALPNGKYEASFTYIGKNNAIDGSKLALVNVQLAASKVFTTRINSVDARTTDFMGTLYPQNVTGGYILRADNLNNPPITLDSRPFNTSFQVNITDSYGNPFIDATASVNTSAGSSIAGNVLTIVGAGGALNLRAGCVISGSGVTAGTYIVSLGTGTGGNGTYNVSVSQSVSATAISGTGNDLAGYSLSLKLDPLV